jgi:iron complex transport system ATP-binding protein
VIDLDGVSVRYGARPALSDVSLRVGPGEWVALIGPNGAGKSTLLRALTGLARFHGRIDIRGTPAGELSRRDRARLIAYVPQQPELPPDMTVAEYVLLGRTPHIRRFHTETDEDRQICADLLSRLALSAFAGRRLGTLSGGELQRLVLARGLAQQAPVLVLDEPTSALDLGRRVDALELVDELRTERGLTVVTAVHDLTLAGQFADRLALLDGGRLVAAGVPAQVLRADLLSRHYDASVLVLTTEAGIVVTSQRQELSA